LWGVFFCVILSHFSKYNCNCNWNFCYFIFVYSQHVSAPTGHLQVKYNITYTFEVISVPQRIRYSLIVYLCGVNHLISIYSLCNENCV
jgi:hypothetical protein